MTAWRFVRYWLYIVHRWLGIFACLLFAIWFASGLVMSYVGYPEAQPARRYQALQPIDWSQVRLDPEGLMSYLGLPRFPRELRLEMLLGEPIYRMIDWDGRRVSVSARSGERVGSVESGQAVTIAQDFAKAHGRWQTTALRDQWTVPERFNALRPLHRIAMDDAAATEVYVSAKTGEVALATTRTQRFWNSLRSMTRNTPGSTSTRRTASCSLCSTTPAVAPDGGSARYISWISAGWFRTAWPGTRSCGR